MKFKTARAFVFVSGTLLLGLLCRQLWAADIGGELKKWHKITLTFDGPKTSEAVDPNPFLYYRLNVKFVHDETGRSYVVPGYFAADGTAANTSADSGNKWRVHFAPDEQGLWRYTVSFRQGQNVAVSEEADAGKPWEPLDGFSGSFSVTATDKTGRDFRGKGMLRYVGKHHLQFAETGEFFLKCGADAPENFLAYADFDGDFKTDGHKDDLIKTWEPHVKDWQPGDPTWQDERGKGIIGAINYLSSEGMNVFSFIPMNIAGDDRNVFPYTTYDERSRMDVSRLAQWEIVFEHADKIGMYLHFKTLETENELLLDNGDLGPQRKLYYRELIARFSHHLALNWNLGEEINDASHEQKVAWADYFWTHDPYQHHIVIHNMGDPHYDLLGDASALTGFSLQTSKPDFSQVHRRTRDYVDRSVAASKPWVVACDEPGDASHALITDEEDPTHDNARKNALWGNIMAGGAGVEWYFGYKHPHSDLTCQDFRTREKMWTQCRYALEFFDRHEIPFWDMKCEDELTASQDDYVLCKPGEVYLVYLKRSGQVTIDVGSGKFNYGWFNPRTGEGLNGLLDSGSTEGRIELVARDDNDWLLVIRGEGRLTLVSDTPTILPADRLLQPGDAKTIVFEEVSGMVAVEAEHFAAQIHDDVRKWYVASKTQTSGVTPDGDDSHADAASNGPYVEVLPDTRRSNKDKLIGGQSFSNEAGKMAILVYPVHFNTIGRYYVWVRAYSTGSKDNGLYVGVNGTWPDSGQRLQWCEGKQSWRWESKQRTAEQHCGEPYKIFLDIEQPGLHSIEFSMREDGFEFDKWLMTRDRDFERPADGGPAERRFQRDSS